MITTRSEHTVTCEYCDFREITENLDTASALNTAHEQRCEVRRAAKRVSKNPGEVETFLLGYKYYPERMSKL